MPNNKSNLISAAVSVAAGLLLSAGALAADYAPSSVLSSGQWVKIHVDSTTVYRIDHSTLRQWGFPDPAKVRVFGYGSVEQAHTLNSAPDDLPPVPVRHSGDALYFYAESDRRIQPSTTSSLLIHRNYYSNGSYYFLTASLPGEIVGESDITSQDKPLTTHTAIDLRNPEIYNIDAAGVYFFSHDITDRPEGLTFSFSAPDFSGNGYLAYRYAYLHEEDTSQNIEVNFSGEVSYASFSPTAHRQNTIEHRLYSLSSLKKINILSASQNPFEVRFYIPADKYFDRLAFSEVYFMYSRLNRFIGPSMNMDFLDNRTTALSACLGNLPKGTEVWDVTTPRAAVRLKQSVDANGDALVTLPATTATQRRICIFSPDADLPTPEFAGEVTGRNLHALPSVDYLIVTTDALLSEAERLAAAHREKQGLEVAVVTQTEVFNEFSSGASHPNGLRKFVRMLCKRADRPLKYMLLMGSPTFDPRQLTSDDGIEHLVGYEVERTDYAASDATDYATDLYFGIMSDNIAGNLPSAYTEIPVSIGRAPVSTPAEAKIFVDKSVAYLNDPKLAGRPDLAVLVACEGDKDAHLKEAENLRTDILKSAPFTTCTRIYNALYPFDKSVERYPTFANLSTGISRSPFLLNYTGHSGSFELGSVISVPMIGKLVFKSMPVTILASCRTTPINNSINCIGRELFLHPDGPIALLGSGRDVYMSNNHILNEEFVRQLVAPDGPKSIGDVWRTTINITGKRGTNQRVNNFCYNFLADPALPVRRPDRKMVLDLSSDTVSGDAVTNPPSLSPLRLEGRILTADGTTDDSFDGSMLLTLYDAPYSTRRYVHSKGDADSIMILDERPLLETAVDVKAGQWAAIINPPLSSRSGTNRLSMVAYSNDGHIACGVDSTLTVCNPLSDITTDNTAPEIELYINSPETPDGAETDPSPVVYASVSDSLSGVPGGLANIGQMPTLTLDSYNRLSDVGTAFRFEPDGSAKLVYPLSNLSDGRHTLTLQARDAAGNSARETISFTVINRPIAATMTVDSIVTRSSVELNLIHNLTTDPTCRLIIRDMNGKTVLSRKGVSFPFVFDFLDDSGHPLHDGTYSASVLLTDGLRSGASQEIRFTLIRHKY